MLSGSLYPHGSSIILKQPPAFCSNIPGARVPRSPYVHTYRTRCNEASYYCRSTALRSSRRTLPYLFPASPCRKVDNRARKGNPHSIPLAPLDCFHRSCVSRSTRASEHSRDTHTYSTRTWKRSLCRHHGVVTLSSSVMQEGIAYCSRFAWITVNKEGCKTGRMTILFAPAGNGENERLEK